VLPVNGAVTAAGLGAQQGVATDANSALAAAIVRKIRMVPSGSIARVKPQ
jgi:hypothetical protein